MAKTLPSRTVVQPPKYTSQGIPLEQVEREQQEEAEKKRYMIRTVKNIVENGFLENSKFHFLNTNALNLEQFDYFLLNKRKTILDNKNVLNLHNHNTKCLVCRHQKQTICLYNGKLFLQDKFW